VSHELTTGVVEETLVTDDGRWRQVATGLEYGSVTTTRFRITDGDPLSATTRCERTFDIGRGEWQTRVQVWSELRSDKDLFHLTSSCEAFAGAEQVFSRTWTFDVVRDLV
jgi:hypothetical protein